MKLKELREMTNIFYILILGSLIATIFTGKSYAGTFEFLSYTPPSGWTNQAAQDKTSYQRKEGIGLIAFYPGYPTNRSASEEFAGMWRVRLEPTLKGTAPQPQIQSDGDYTVAFGAQVVNARGTMTTVMLAAFVGQGRAVCVLSMSAGENVLSEVTVFFDSIKINPKTSAATANSGSISNGEIEVDFDVPPGYVSKREGQMIMLAPKTMDEKTPCVYGISPPRSSSGNLETDARKAILEMLAGWQIKSDSYNAMRGLSAEGWNYFWFRTDVQSLVNGSYQNLAGMTMTFPAGTGRVNIVWGFGNPAQCKLDDLTFARLFHSLRPRGWTSDGGNAFTRELKGTWRLSESIGIAQYKFMENGRYEFGMSTTTSIGLQNTTSSSVSDGRFDLRGTELVLTPDRRNRGVSKYRVRIYDEYVHGRWTRAMSLLDESSNPALDVQYMRIEDSR